MQTTELLDLMGMLKLHGMRAAFEETLTEGLKRKLSFHQILGKLFACEIEERKLRSIRYQLGAANLPMAKSLDTFQFAATQIDETLIRQWHEGVLVESARNLILVGGTGTGKTHLAVAIASQLIKHGRRACFLRRRHRAHARMPIAVALQRSVGRLPPRPTGWTLHLTIAIREPFVAGRHHAVAVPVGPSSAHGEAGPVADLETPFVLGAARVAAIVEIGPAGTRPADGRGGSHFAPAAPASRELLRVPDDVGLAVGRQVLASLADETVEAVAFQRAARNVALDCRPGTVAGAEHDPATVLPLIRGSPCAQHRSTLFDAVARLARRDRWQGDRGGEEEEEEEEAEHGLSRATLGCRLNRAAKDTRQRGITASGSKHCPDLRAPRAHQGAKHDSSPSS